MLAAARASQTVLDVSQNTSLFASGLRDYPHPLMMVGKQTIQSYFTEDQVHVQMEAMLFQCLSSLNRPSVDLFYWQVDEALEEFQINAALETLEIARQEGVIGSLGLAIGAVPLASLALLQFHDAFESILVRRAPKDDGAFEMVQGLATARRVGVLSWISSAEVESAAYNDPRLVTVRSASDIDQVMGVTA